MKNEISAIYRCTHRNLHVLGNLIAIIKLKL
jgi:hypothetical protein